MEKTLASVVGSIPHNRKTAARAVLVDLHEPARSTLADCFRQFGIECIAVGADAAGHFQNQKFEACVIKLGQAAEPVMEAARTSPSNSRMIIYGLGGSAQDAMRYSKYGINAVFHEPLERSAALKLVRATQTLVLHEFRRYVRIPVITEVSIVSSDSRRFTASSREISAGGMSLVSGEDLGIGQAVEISFALLTLPRIWVRATVSWRHKKNIGLRFDTQDDRRSRIKGWVDAYLES